MFLTALCVQSLHSEDIELPDAQLESLIRDSLGKHDGALTDSDLASLTSLNSGSLVSETKISDLTGIEYATNLTELTLRFQTIEELSPLASLANLEQLDLSGNPITDLTQLGSLAQLRVLSISEAEITDLTPLASLSSLQWLFLSKNSISNLSPIAGIATLSYLDFEDNPIADFSPLSQITTLTTLNLRNTGFNSLAPLAPLKSLRSLDASENLLSSLEGLNQLPQLQQFQVSDNYLTDITPLAEIATLQLIALNRNFIDFTAGTPNADTLSLLQNAGVSISSLVQKTPTLELSDNAVETPYYGSGGNGSINITTNSQWEASVDSSWLSLTSQGDGYGDATLSFSVISTPDLFGPRTATITVSTPQYEESFEIEQRPYLEVVFPDPQLELALRVALDNFDDPITDHQLETLNTLSVPLGPSAKESIKITDLTGLQYADQLQNIYLDNHAISDISQLAGFVKLKTLSLSNNLLNDLTPLKFLTALQTLNVDNNFIPLSDTQQSSVINSLVNRGGTAKTEPQLSTTFSFSIDDDTFGPEGGSGTLFVESNDAWEAASDTDWITFDNGSTGTRVGSIKFTVSEFLELSTPRVATISIHDQTVTVTQRLPEPIAFTDPDLETVLIEKLALETEYVTDFDLENLLDLELIRDPFDPEDPDISSLNGLQHAVNLGSLSISGHTTISLDPIASLDSITNINVLNASLQNIDALSQLTRLETITLKNCGLSYIPILNCEDSLISLDLGDNNIVDIAPLTPLSKIETLTLNYNPIEDLSALAELLEISYLDLSGTQPSDLAPLQGLSKVNTLNLSETEISEINALSSFSALISLDISANQIVSLEPLTTITSLTEIYGFSNEVEDLTPILKLPNLVRIEFPWNKVHDLSPFLISPNVEHLDLSFNYITDLSPITNLPNLKELSVQGNFLDLSSGSAQNEHLQTLSEQGVTGSFDFQRALSGTVESSAFSVGPEKKTLSTNFTTTGRLKASTSANWISFDYDPFAGTGPLEIHVDENDFGVSRNALIDLGFAIITVEQSYDANWTAYLNSLGLDPAAAENRKDADRDGDGQSNEFESQTGFDMSDASSKLIFRIIPNTASENSFYIHYSPTNPGYSGQIQFSSDMETWETISEENSTEVENYQIIHHTPTSTPTYYRQNITPIN
ncbi:Leucine Rich Repeat domain protein [Verrucomicrobiia bacterium DG1235]|nr:Leucine Rich Repeat domain protein [Verrucomicrobiae bacterium DG1235]